MSGGRCDGREVEGVTEAFASLYSDGKAGVENGFTKRLGFGGVGGEG